MKGHFLNPTFWLNKKGWKFKMRQFGVVFKHCVHIVHRRTTECFSFSSSCRQKYFINKLILQGISVLSSGIHGRDDNDMTNYGQYDYNSPFFFPSCPSRLTINEMHYCSQYFIPSSFLTLISLRSKEEIKVEKKSRSCT